MKAWPSQYPDSDSLDNPGDDQWGGAEPSEPEQQRTVMAAAPGLAHGCMGANALDAVVPCIYSTEEGRRKKFGATGSHSPTVPTKGENE